MEGVRWRPEEPAWDGGLEDLAGVGGGACRGAVSANQYGSVDTTLGYLGRAGCKRDKK